MTSGNFTAIHTFTDFWDREVVQELTRITLVLLWAVTLLVGTLRAV